MTAPVNTAPPLPPVTFRVGVSGHRPNRLQHADLPLLAAQMTRALETVQAAVARCAAAHTHPLPATCRVLSSLAEGTDRLAAEAALGLGYRLDAPLPFPQADYENDFTEADSLAAFRRLLGSAHAIFELPPVAPPLPRALGYRAAGEVILRGCDLLLVVWDGDPAAGIGGTPEMIDRATEAGLPVLAIDAAAPHAMRLLPVRSANSRTETDALAGVAALVEATLMPSPAQRALEAEYTGEHWPGRVTLSSYLFTRLLGDGRLRLPRAPVYANAGTEIRNSVLRPYYVWTDVLATRYRELSRSAALQLQMLAAVAVLSGLLSIPFSIQQIYVLRCLSCVELGATIALVTMALLVTRKPWHARWLRHRALAEQVRSLDLLVPLAENLPWQRSAGFAPAQSEDFGSQFFEAIAREVGLPTAQVDAAYVSREREAVEAAIKGQAHFQASVARRYGTAERTLRRLGLGLFGVTVLLSFYDVAKSFEVVHFDSMWIVTLAALLPALGATFAGVAAQGEFQRLAARAEAMSQMLETLGERLEADRIGSLAELATAARAAAEVLTSEVRDWQALVALRKPSLPG